MTNECAKFLTRPARLTHGRAGAVIALWLALWLPLLAAQVPSEELHTAAAVRRLSVDEARLKAPVRLRGVVTFFDESLYSRFIQDETAGIYLFDSSLPIHLVPGQLVEVEGASSPGEYAPIVVPEKITVVGDAPLPAAKPVSYEQLASGQEDSQFVEISGIVRSVQFHEASKHFIVEIATGGGRLSVYVRDLPVKRREDLLDSTVRVRGVCSTQFNHQRQLFSIRLLVPRSEDLVIRMPAPTDPFATATRPIGSLLQFAPQESFGHRVKVAGNVIFFEAGSRLFLQDGDQGIEVETAMREPLQLGDRVEALGFVVQGEYTPVLQDAVYRKLASGEPVVPSALDIDEALKGKHDCRLIRVSGRLLDRALHGTERTLILQNDHFVFQTFLRPPEGQDVFAHLQNGSRVEVIGVCRIEPGEWRAGEDWRAKSFRLQMRSPADVRLIEPPSWWTLQRVLWIAFAVSLAALGAFAWVAVLRRQVAERGRQLETEIQERQLAERRREIEQERTRVAQDLHDELGSTLTEVSMLGSLLKTQELPPETRERYLDKLMDVSRAVVATLDEIVWAVNPKYDSVASLASYYSMFAQRFLNLAGIACRLRVATTFPEAPLDSRLRHGVFLAFKEALNNAVRHSRATQILVEMGAVDDQLKIVVEDNGRGFDPGHGQPGSDGIASMKERMAKLNGRCEIKTEAGKGTTVELWLPLDGHKT